MPGRRDTAKPYIFKITFEKVYHGRDEDEARETAECHMHQTFRRSITKLDIERQPDDDFVCEYGKLNRTCNGQKCKECEREDWLQAMNEDDAEARYDR